MKSCIHGFIFLLCFALTFETSAAADDNASKLLEIGISESQTRITVNMPVDYMFREIQSENVYEISLKNCRVDLQNKDKVFIPLVSPIFESIELATDKIAKDTFLRLKLSSGVRKPAMNINQDENSLVFTFGNALSHTSEMDRKSVTIVRDTPAISVPIGNPVDLLPLLTPEYFAPDTPTPKVSAETEFPQSTLQDMYYTQGDSGGDVITLEFIDDSPIFIRQMDDSGKIDITFYNVIVPEEMFREDEFKKEVSGLNLRSIYLKKFQYNERPDLLMTIKTKGITRFNVEDSGGIIELFLSGEGK